MNILKLTMITLWMIFLTSCKKDIICKEVALNQIDPVPMYDISFQFNRCRVRCFDLNDWKALPISSCPSIKQPEADLLSIVEYEGEELIESVNLPLIACEGISGFDATSIAEDIRPKIKSMSKIRKDTCRF